MAERSGARLAAGDAAGSLIRGVATLDTAGPEDLAFCDSADFANRLATTRAGACITSERFAGQARADLTLLSSDVRDCGVAVLAQAARVDLAQLADRQRER